MWLFLLSLILAATGHGLVVVMGSITGRCFRLRFPEEWDLDNRFGPLPDGSFRTHPAALAAGPGAVVPRWVSGVQLLGFLLRCAGLVLIVVSGIMWLFWRNSDSNTGPTAIDMQDELRPNITAWIESGSYYIEANQTATRIGIGRRPNSEDIDRMRSLLREAVTAANAVDPVKLSKVYPGLGEHFRDYYLPGIERRLDALDNPRHGKMQQADTLLQEWDNWYFAHQTDLNRRLRELGLPFE